MGNKAVTDRSHGGLSYRVKNVASAGLWLEGPCHVPGAPLATVYCDIHASMRMPHLVHVLRGKSVLCPYRCKNRVWGAGGSGTVPPGSLEAGSRLSWDRRHQTQALHYQVDEARAVWAASMGLAVPGLTLTLSSLVPLLPTRSPFPQGA